MADSDNDVVKNEFSFETHLNFVFRSAWKDFAAANLAAGKYYTDAIKIADVMLDEYKSRFLKEYT